MASRTPCHVDSKRLPSQDSDCTGNLKRKVIRKSCAYLTQLEQFKAGQKVHAQEPNSNAKVLIHDRTGNQPGKVDPNLEGRNVIVTAVTVMVCLAYIGKLLEGYDSEGCDLSVVMSTFHHSHEDAEAQEPEAMDLPVEEEVGALGLPEGMMIGMRMPMMMPMEITPAMQMQMAMPTMHMLMMMQTQRTMPMMRTQVTMMRRTARTGSSLMTSAHLRAAARTSPAAT